MISCPVLKPGYVSLLKLAVVTEMANAWMLACASARPAWRWRLAPSATLPLRQPQHPGRCSPLRLAPDPNCEPSRPVLGQYALWLHASALAESLCLALPLLASPIRQAGQRRACLLGGGSFGSKTLNLGPGELASAFSSDCMHNAAHRRDGHPRHAGGTELSPPARIASS